MQEFFQWVGSVWVDRNEVPTSAEELAGFDIASLIPEYRAYIAAGGQVDMEHGLSIQQVWLMGQLTAGAPLVCVINTLQPPQPSKRVTQLFPLNGNGIIEMLRQLFQATPGLLMTTGVYDGDAIVHVITLQGMDAETGNILFYDPWPGRSLLCEENNSAGVAAGLAPGKANVWMLPPESMASVIHFVLVPMTDLDAVVEARLAEQSNAGLAAIEASDFFQWFHLEKVNSEIQGQFQAIDYRPSGALFRDAVMLRIILAPGQVLTGARLILHRSFVDSQKEGIFAADIAKSFVLFLSGEPDAQALSEHFQEHLREIDSAKYSVGGWTLSTTNMVADCVAYLELTWH